MNRRSFVKNTGLAIGAGAILPALTRKIASAAGAKNSLDTWADVRAQFNLTPDRIHMAQMLFATHPKPVREAIEMHRKKFDENPVEYLEANLFSLPDEVRKSAAAYIGADPREIALTDSTTMGISVLYHGLKIQKGDEILTTTHDHYITEKSLEFSTGRNGASIRRIALYDDPFTASEDVIVSRIQNAITPATRIVAVTWVHSSTGVKLPIHSISEVIRNVNHQRSASDRIYFCVDGVHGFGIENVTMEELGCDFFAAGTHKWIFGPRGTGILWAKKDAWDMITPTIPSFGYMTFGMWLGAVPEGKINFADWCSPGGFQSYEHQWAMPAAFDFHLNIGKSKVAERTHQLNTQLKEGLLTIKHIKLHTPVSTSLSAGINCFDVEGLKPDDVVKKLLEKKIISSSSPYKTSYVRLTPCMLNTEEEVNLCLKELERLKT
jgi:selenocysteine lyase/cysteine desulfurase